MKNMLKALVVLCLIAASLSPCTAVVQYTYKQFDIMPGFTSTAALDINNRGDIVGTTYSPDHTLHAFYRNYYTGKVYDLGEGCAYGINNIGQVVGCSYASGGNAFIWSEKDGFTYLGIGAGFAINDSGQVVGMFCPDNGYNRAAFWDSNGELTDLSPLFGYMESYAYGINKYGEVCGYGSVGMGNACYWSKSYGARHLETLPGGWFSNAHDINDQGIIVGSSVINGTDEYITSWDHNGHIQPISNNRVASYAMRSMGINNSGQIAANCYLWDTDGSRFTLPGSGYAREINDSGWIVGEINSRATIWTPVPEPSSLLALVGGVSCIGFFARRRK